MSLADGADLIFTGINFEDAAANVAEHYDIPLATLHYFPLRPNGQSPAIPAGAVGPLGGARRSGGCRGVGRRRSRTSSAANWAYRRRPAPRRDGSPNADRWRSRPTTRRAFPGWRPNGSKQNGQRPVCRHADTRVWRRIPMTRSRRGSPTGTPPIFFGFGSIPVESPADTIAMIAAACARLGERALVGAAGTDFSNVPHFEHVKVVGAMNYATVFPACRAVVHHGGSSTTPIGMRAGVPQLILYWDLVHAIYGAAVKRLKVGTARRFSTATEESLVADLRTILAPDYVARAREFATRITEPATSAAAAADALEDFARLRRVG